MILGNRIFLRALEPADVDLLYGWENDPENWKVSNTISPFSKHILEQYVNSVDDLFSNRQLRMMICLLDSKEAIGCIDFFDFEPLHKRIGLGVLLAEKDQRGKGLASESLSLMIDYAFNNLEVHQLYCNITESNEASIALFGKHGFQQTGHKKDWIRSEQRWEDELFFQLVNPNG